MVVAQVHDLLHFFPPSGSRQLSFVWGSSAESGFMHLYLVTVSLEPSVSETSSETFLFVFCRICNYCTLTFGIFDLTKCSNRLRS